jgi:hypothetical protein
MVVNRNKKYHLLLKNERSLLSFNAKI